MQVIDQTQLIPLIKKLMEKNEINNVQVSKMIGCTRAYITEVLKSDELSHLNAKIKILKALGVEAEYKKEVKIFIP